MTVRATKFIPEVMLSAPRRQAGIPNCTGELILYIVRFFLSCPNQWLLLISDLPSAPGLDVLVRKAHQDDAGPGH